MVIFTKRNTNTSLGIWRSFVMTCQAYARGGQLVNQSHLSFIIKLRLIWSVWQGVWIKDDLIIASQGVEIHPQETSSCCYCGQVYNYLKVYIHSYETFKKKIIRSLKHGTPFSRQQFKRNNHKRKSISDFPNEQKSVGKSHGAKVPQKVVPNQKSFDVW